MSDIVGIPIVFLTAVLFYAPSDGHGQMTKPAAILPSIAAMPSMTLRLAATSTRRGHAVDRQLDLSKITVALKQVLDLGFQLGIAEFERKCGRDAHAKEQQTRQNQPE